MTTILCGDALTVLQTLPDCSVQCVATSPPYYGLRSYLPNGHPDKALEMGMEETPQEYVEKLVAVFREVRRVLRDDGVVFLNLGDTYAANRSYQVPDNKHCEVGNSKGSCVPVGLKPKDLIGIPWRVAFALQEDGWYLRQDIIWSKDNPMPESVTDRCTKSHEYMFLLSKNARYFFDQVAISEPETMKPQNRWTPRKENPNAKVHGMPAYRQQEGGTGGGTRNRRSVWTIATQPYSGAHFATMPRKLAETCILAGTSEAGCCSQCGKPWERVVEKLGKSTYARICEEQQITHKDMQEKSKERGTALKAGKEGWGSTRNANGTTPHLDSVPLRTIGFRPSCSCNAPAQPCVVLDPFGGSGTTGEVAQRLGRKAILIELNPEYLPLIEARTRQPSLDFNMGEQL